MATPALDPSQVDLGMAQVYGGEVVVNNQLSATEAAVIIAAVDLMEEIAGITRGEGDENSVILFRLDREAKHLAALLVG